MQLPAVAARNFRKDELGIIKQGQLYLPAEIWPAPGLDDTRLS
jgi:hypothetical protein